VDRSCQWDCGPEISFWPANVGWMRGTPILVVLVVVEDSGDIAGLIGGGLWSGAQGCNMLCIMVIRSSEVLRAKRVLDCC